MRLGWPTPIDFAFQDETFLQVGFPQRPTMFLDHLDMLQVVAAFKPHHSIDYKSGCTQKKI